MSNKLIGKYSRFVSYHPYTVVSVVILVSIFAFYWSQQIENVDMNHKNMLPKTLGVVKALDILEDNFGGSESAMISVELDPQYVRSNEARDLRDPEMIAYLNILTQMAATVEHVNSAGSVASLLKSMNGNILPRTRSQIINLTRENTLISQYLSEDSTLTVIRLQLADDYKDEELVQQLEEVIGQTPRPAGLKVSLAGDPVTGPVIMGQMGPDMAKTSQFSFIAIIVILLLILRSVQYTISPLIVLGIGVIWALGFVGLIGMDMSPASSGVISMIMGVGIDFGIQTVIRFREELRAKKPEEAMRITIDSVLVPMATTTIAALIGFQAMQLGELSIIKELGKIMSYGITACFVAAITVLPAFLVLGERYSFYFEDIKKKFKSIFKRGTSL